MTEKQEEHFNELIEAIEKQIKDFDKKHEKRLKELEKKLDTIDDRLINLTANSKVLSFIERTVKAIEASANNIKQSIRK